MSLQPPLVRCLLFSRCPATVVWCVVPIVVLPIERQRWMRTWPHIVKELTEVVPPRSTHSDASTPVVLVRLALWIVAALLRADPCLVLRWMKLLATVPELALARFLVQASAAPCVTLYQVAVAHRRQATARTSATPQYDRTSWDVQPSFKRMQGRQSIELSPCEISDAH